LAGFALPGPGGETNPGSTVEARGREILRTLRARGSVPHVAPERGKRPSSRRGAREGLSWSSTITWCTPQWKTIQTSSTLTFAARSHATA